MRKSVYWLPILLILLAICGCTDNLTETQAEKIVKEKIHFPIINSVSIEHGLIAYRYDSLPDFYYVLQRQGLLNIEYLGQGGFLVKDYRFRVTPTAEAKKYIVEEEKDPIKQGETGEFMYSTWFKTAETYFDEIKDIHEIPSMNAADVRYTVRMKNFTPFWSYYLDKSHKRPDTVGNRTFGIIKTTEGWKPVK